MNALSMSFVVQTLFTKAKQMWVVGLTVFFFGSSLIYVVEIYMVQAGLSEVAVGAAFLFPTNAFGHIVWQIAEYEGRGAAFSLTLDESP